MYNQLQNMKIFFQKKKQTYSGKSFVKLQNYYIILINLVIIFIKLYLKSTKQISSNNNNK